MKNENFKNLTAESLVEIAKKTHQKVMADAAKREAAHKKKIAELTAEEGRLKTEITTAKQQLEKMLTDFEILEKRQREAISEEVRKNEMTEDDVKSGRITINQFHAAGKKADELQKTIMARTLESIEKSSDAVRSKGEEIIRLEQRLYAIQSNIYGLSTQPVRSIRLSYKELGDMLDYQLEGFNKDGHIAQSLKVEKENQIMLIERGVGMTSGHTWSNVSLKEAYRVRLDPCLPKKLVASLQEKLDEIKGGEEIRVTIVYHQAGSFWPGDPIEVREEPL